MTASTWPARTQSPGSTEIETTRPPSPTTPTGIARRAASVPVALMLPSTEARPGATTDTVGICSPSSGAKALLAAP